VSEIPADLQEALKDRYEILRELGQGGMAIVYAARDVKMDREVAIKVLLPDLAMALGPERFMREIQIAAHLSHPHILGVYDSGEAVGQLYYVMPLIRGESLRKRLDREKQLPIDEALRISIEVASALDYANRQSVVHRDIKPENILLEEGHAVVADFGIARAISKMDEGKGLTATGMSLGTAAYMSPEQVAAEKDIDGRSDVYSLGCVTYEMLAGQPPFTGPNQAAIMARQAMEMPPSLTVVRNTIPDEIEEVVFQALAKSPVDRFQTAGEYSEALQDCLLIAPTTTRRTMSSRMTQTMKARQLKKTRRKALIGAAIMLPVLVAIGATWKLLAKGPSSGAIAGALDPKRVAVLYFDDLTAGKFGYLADGLAETLIEALKQVQAIDVVSKDAVARFRGKDVRPDSVASTLQAGTLIKGSVNENGNRVKINISVIDGISGADKKVQAFELPEGDLLAVRQSVADSVGVLLREYLGPEVRLRELETGTSSPAAWTLAQRAEKLRKDGAAASTAGDSTSAATSFAQADSLLAQAEKLDPKWVNAIALRSTLAFTRAQSAKTSLQAAPWVDQGLAHAERALKLDSLNLDAREMRGRLRYRRWQLQLDDKRTADSLLTGAREDLSAVTKKDPTRALAGSQLSSVYNQLHDLASANLAAQRAYEGDAFFSGAETVLWQLYASSYNLEQFAQADKWCHEGARRFPKNSLFVSCQLWLRTTDAVRPNADSGWAELKALEKLLPAKDKEFNLRRHQMLVAASLAKSGQKDSARHVLEHARAGIEVDPEGQLLTTEALVRTILHTPQDTAVAFQLLKQYVTGQPLHGKGFAETTHWWWKGLKSDRRWSEFLGGGTSK
jgi:eukaryotic-like serine/threonine-protein kinase